MWEHFHHQADVGIRGIGPTIEKAFEEGAAALITVICNPQTVEPKKSITLHCQAQEKDLLFADWINTLIYEMDVRKMLFARFQVQIENDCLSAEVWGETINPEKHETAVEVKAATFMELKVYETEDGQWAAQCVVDV